MKNHTQIPYTFRQPAVKHLYKTPNAYAFSILIIILMMMSVKQVFAQIDTVIIATDYCTVPGSVRLTALPSPTSPDYTYTWNTNPAETSQVILINKAGNYSVTVKDGNGNEKSASLAISANLVFNGDFELGNTGFISSYIYVSPAPAALEPENRYTVDWDPHYSHKFFWGRDHSTNSGKFMIVNGVDQRETVWSQEISGIIPNTDYYFSAYGISLNGSEPFANLQFSINGNQVGSTTGPLPPHQSNNNPPYNWVQFYGTWNSGNNTSAKLSITDLEPSLRGNDFGLDDISFGTLTPFPLLLNAQSNTPCEGDFLQLTSSVTNGLPPFTYAWTGPNGFTSDQPNPVILNVTQAAAGTYTLQVTDANSCAPVSKDIVVTVNEPSVGGTVTGGTEICAGTNSGMLTLTGHSGSVVRWQSAIAPFNTWNDITNTQNTYTSGPLSETTRFRAVVQKGSCSEAFSTATTVSVEKTAPVISRQAENLTVECDGNGNLNELNAWLDLNGGAEATDNNSSVTWSHDYTSITKLCGSAGSAVVTFTAKDACGNSASTSAVFTITDHTVPVIAALPAPSTISCPSVPEFATATATDDCSGDVTLTFKDVRTDGSCAGSYSITRTWTATDACGNSATASQTINVQDITAPVIAALPAPSTISCPSVPEFATATATDDCSGDVTLTFKDVRTDGSCAGSYSITRTWTATDACGNSATASQTINVQDITAPVITCVSDVIVNNDPGKCAAVLTIAKPSVSENCGTYTLTNSINQTNDASGEYPVGTTVIVWTAKDECGNTSTCTMSVTVNDNEKPVITCAADINTCAGSQPVLVNPTASDNCGIASITNDAPSVFVTGTTPVKWTVIDVHGNKSTCTQTVLISLPVSAEAGPDDKLCSTVPYAISKASASNYTSLSWSHNGHGSLSDAAIINPVYTPSAGETGTIEFTLNAKGSAACGTGEIQDKFTLTIYPVLTVNAGENATIISGATTTLHGTATGGSGILSYNWAPANKLVDNSKLSPITTQLFTTTTFTLNVVDALSSCTASDVVTITVDDVTRPIARDDQATTDLSHTITVNVQENDTDPVGLGLTTSITIAPLHGSAVVNENGTITYTNMPNYTGKVIFDTLTYTICDKGSPVKCASARLFIRIPVDREEEIEVFNLVTPNNDGENEYWHIKGIDNTENEITIFNRWGDKIVKTFKNYKNSSNRWEGKNNKNETLPDGIYFYIIKIKDKDTQTGWIYLRGEGSN